MSKLFAIVAMENMYDGHHGTKDSCVVECLNRDEAEEIGIEMSINPMDTYEIYEIRDTTKSLAQLNDLLFNDEEEFIKKYCIENF